MQSPTLPANKKKLIAIKDLITLRILLHTWCLQSWIMCTRKVRRVWV